MHDNAWSQDMPWKSPDTGVVSRAGSAALRLIADNTGLTDGLSRRLVRGLIQCEACGRRMQSTWNHERAQYRCRFPDEYAVATRSTTRSQVTCARTP